MTNTILNAKEDEEIVQFFEIKTVLSAVIHRKELLNFFRKCVDVSEYLEFTSDRARRIINPARPSLSLNFNLDAALKDGHKYTSIHGDLKNTREAVTERTTLVRQAIIIPMMDLLSETMQYIIDGTESSNIETVNLLLEGQDVTSVKGKLLNITKDEETLKEFFMVSAISSINFPAYDKANIDEDISFNIEIMI